MNTQEKRQLARTYYIKSSMHRKQIAETVGCTEKTLRGWINKYCWDDAKEAETITRPMLLQDAYKQLKAINQKIIDEMNGVPNKELSDAKGVIRKEIEALSDMPLHKYVEVMLEFHNWMQSNRSENILEVVGMTDNFIQYIAKEKGI